MNQFRLTQVAKRILLYLVLTVFIPLNITVCEAYISQSEIRIGNISFGSSLNQVRELYGEPDEIEIIHTKSGKGNVETITYDDRLCVKAINNKIVRCSISSPQITTSYGISVGDSINKLRSVYGKEDGFYGAVIRYQAIEDQNKELNFYYKDGIITNISIDSNENRYVRSEGATPSSQLALGGIRLTNTMSDVVNVYGFPARYRNYTASYGNGLEISYFEDSKSSQIRDIRVTENNGFATPSGITVGMDEGIIKQLYGVPDRLLIKKTEHKYTYWGAGNDCLKYIGFAANNGKITEICLHWAD